LPEAAAGRTRRFSATLLWGIGLLAAVVLPSLAAPWLAPHDPGEINPTPVAYTHLTLPTTPYV
jgi:hypothetical protein